MILVVEFGYRRRRVPDGEAWGGWVPLERGFSFAGKNSRGERRFLFWALVGWGLLSITRFRSRSNLHVKDL